VFIVVTGYYKPENQGAILMKSVIEIRSYIIKDGKRDEFHRLVSLDSYPLMMKWGIDVVAFGPSVHDENSYVLMRAFTDDAERIASQEKFYGSDDWRNGPRKSIVELIENDTNIVLEVNENTILAIKDNHIGIDSVPIM